MQFINSNHVLWCVQMCGLNVYSYIEHTYIQFYKVHRAQAKKMDIGDWIPGFFHQELIQGGESLLDRVRRIILEELAIIPAPEPLMELHPGEPSGTAAGEVEDEEEEEEEQEEQEEHEKHEVEGEEFSNGVYAGIRSSTPKEGYAGGDPAEQACARVDGRGCPGDVLSRRDRHLL